MAASQARFVSLKGIPLAECSLNRLMQGRSKAASPGASFHGKAAINALGRCLAKIPTESTLIAMVGRHADEILPNNVKGPLRVSILTAIEKSAEEFTLGGNLNEFKRAVSAAIGAAAKKHGSGSELEAELGYLPASLAEKAVSARTLWVAAGKGLEGANYFKPAPGKTGVFVVDGAAEGYHPIKRS